MAMTRWSGLTYGNTVAVSYGYGANNDLTRLTQTFAGSAATFRSVGVIPTGAGRWKAERVILPEAWALR
ncbi:hypothetical protein [Telmatospirillum sp.]|uniref:hypothetical protein n=1 Tax=Telmatospirillum sp. TaxID=2079197 RepID=UPI0028466078|nr:hypothetical protein [Telmatospirillum sp.]MDR3437380.1 hypothetical protein [Telmatospirillum sp.]